VTLDILIALPKEPSFDEATEIRAEVLGRAEELELPPYTPIDPHVVGEEA